MDVSGKKKGKQKNTSLLGGEKSEGTSSRKNSRYTGSGGRNSIECDAEVSGR